MRQRNTATRWCRYKLKGYTVFVKPTAAGIMDGLIRCNFIAQVCPPDGEPSGEFDVRAFYTWDAANEALKIYQETHGNDEN